MRSVLEKQRLRVAAPLRRPSARAHLALQYVGVRARLDVAAVAVSSARAKRRTVACGRVRCRSCLQLHRAQGDVSGQLAACAVDARARQRSGRAVAPQWSVGELWAQAATSSALLLPFSHILTAWLVARAAPKAVVLAQQAERRQRCQVLRRQRTMFDVRRKRLGAAVQHRLQLRQLIAVHLPRVVLEKAAKQPAHASRIRAARHYVLLVR